MPAPLSRMQSILRGDYFFFLYVVVSLKMNIVSLKTLNVIHVAHVAAFAVLVCLKILMNVKSAKNLEFIRTTCSSRGRAKSPRPRRQVKKDRRRSYCYVENVFGRQRRHRALQPAAVEWVVRIHSTRVEKIRQITPFYAKQTQFFPVINLKMMISLKNKPNSNPIQSQTNPIMSQK